MYTVLCSHQHLLLLPRYWDWLSGNRDSVPWKSWSPILRLGEESGAWNPYLIGRGKRSRAEQDLRIKHHIWIMAAWRNGIASDYDFPYLIRRLQVRPLRWSLKRAPGAFCWTRPLLLPYAQGNAWKGDQADNVWMPHGKARLMLCLSSAHTLLLLRSATRMREGHRLSQIRVPS